jgi:hypothetical protein
VATASSFFASASNSWDDDFEDADLASNLVKVGGDCWAAGERKESEEGSDGDLVQCSKGTEVPQPSTPSTLGGRRWAKWRWTTPR